MNKSTKNVILAVILLALMLITKPTSAQEVLVLDWFEFKTQTYGVNTLTFDFYYFEDHSVYIGTINFAHNGDEWFVDEFVDLIPYTDPYTGETLTEDEIFAGMEYFAQSVLYMLDDDPELLELAWSQGTPQDFGDHTDYWQTLMNVEALTHQLYLPIVIR